MFLIADSGSTKTHWVLANREKVFAELRTKGFNPYYYRRDDFVRDLQTEVKQQLPPGEIKNIFFYGAGCSSEENCRLVSTALQEVFPEARVETDHDLYAAGLALFGTGKGIACILGTGSNSCLWDNRKILENVPSLGYLLGDEGSGTHIGKLLLTGILLGEADDELSRKFYDHFDLTFEEALNRVYKQPDPNLFFSSLSPFVSQNLHHPFCRQVAEQSLGEFVSRYLSKYPGCRTLPVSFTGSVAYHFREVLKSVLDSNGMHLESILPRPMEGLLKFHQERV